MALLVVAVTTGCNKIEDVPVPIPAYPIISETNKLTTDSRGVMEGVYSVSGEDNIFGDQVVIKWTRTSLLIACDNGRYFVLNGGYLDSVVIFQGYWRYANNDDTGPASFFISKTEGGTEIVTGQATQNIILRGGYGEDSGLPSKSLVFQYQRPFSDKVKESKFHILAHRGGGRTSDRLPVSENSIEMINYTEKYGSTGIEIDVRITTDGVPFLYHDGDINIRLTQKGPLQGDVASYTWDELEKYVRLIHGEKIPSLEDALNFVVDSTNINFVYLDMKASGLVIDKTIEIQARILEKARQAGKELIVVIGIPNDEIFDYFTAIPGFENIPSLCELTIEDTQLANSAVWAPRWTQGTQNSLVEQMHSEGRLVVTWTVDQANYIKEFIEEGNFDGLLTNYPSLVAYYHYIQ